NYHEQDESLRDREQQLRLRLISDVVSKSAGDASKLDKYLATYLNTNPPDFVSGRLRDARDKIRPAPKLNPHKVECDFSVFFHGPPEA
ncbi:hypothetical protein K2X33_04490, partial [bacterium]|nr:hypothetical protein [bacterium]